VTWCDSHPPAISAPKRTWREIRVTELDSSSVRSGDLPTLFAALWDAAPRLRRVRLARGGCGHGCAVVCIPPQPQTTERTMAGDDEFRKSWHALNCRAELDRGAALSLRTTFRARIRNAILEI